LRWDRATRDAIRSHLESDNDASLDAESAERDAGRNPLYLDLPDDSETTTDR
jgi:hypothetical protein